MTTVMTLTGKTVQKLCSRSHSQASCYKDGCNFEYDHSCHNISNIQWFVAVFLAVSILRTLKFIVIKHFLKYLDSKDSISS